uniref:Uncharacterized protein n=1 Tax=Rhizophora mucronata TaxID=61149 RepID=A0A2P2Q067_RHIMU
MLLQKIRDLTKLTSPKQAANNSVVWIAKQSLQYWFPNFDFMNKYIINYQSYSYRRKCSKPRHDYPFNSWRA